MKSKILFTALMLFAIGGFAQQQFDGAKGYYRFEAKEAAKIGAAINAAHWDTLPGKIPVLYSKNSEVRAKAIQALVMECIEFYKPLFPKIKFDLYIMVLSQKDWNKIHLTNLCNYGMPTCLPEIKKLFIAADKQAVGELFGETDHTDDTQLSRFDCIALHELGHSFLQTSNKLFTGRLWADEFLASYFAICFFEQHKNYPGLPQVGEKGYTPKYKSLADFERLYSNVGDQNYGWYQAQFQNLGYLLYPKFKTELIIKFIENNSAAGKKLSPIDLLKQLAPEAMSQWLKGME